MFRVWCLKQVAVFDALPYEGLGIQEAKQGFRV